MTLPIKPSIEEEKANLKLMQQKKIKEIVAQLEQLIAKQHAEKSFFSKISVWYCKRSLGIKLGLGLLSGGAGALAGLLYMPVFLFAPIVGGIIGLVLYFFPSILFIQHRFAEEKYKEVLASEIIKMNTILQESIAAFQALEAPMSQLLTSLDAKNKEKAKDVQDFKESVTTFKRQVNDSESSFLNLQENQTILANNSESLAQAIQRTSTAHTEFSQHQQELGKINAAFASTQQLLQKDAVSFNQMTAELEQSNVSLRALNRRMSELERDAKINQQKLENHITDLSQTINHRTNPETPTQQQESSQELQKRTLDHLSQFLAMRKNNRFFDGPNTTSSNVIAMPRI